MDATFQTAVSLLVPWKREIFSSRLAQTLYLPWHLMITFSYCLAYTELFKTIKNDQN